MEKYTYIRKTVTWQNRRYEVRGKTEQEACDKLAELITSLKNAPYATGGSTTMGQWFVQWRETYKAFSNPMTPISKTFRCLCKLLLTQVLFCGNGLLGKSLSSIFEEHPIAVFSARSASLTDDICWACGAFFRGKTVRNRWEKV